MKVDPSLGWAYMNLWKGKPMGSANLGDPGIRPWPGCLTVTEVMMDARPGLGSEELTDAFQCVNSDPIGTRGPGTLMLLGGMADKMGIVMKLIFRYRPMPWNYVSRPSDGHYYEMRSLEGKLQYQERDFSGLIGVV
jgi:hypothetical protein